MQIFVAIVAQPHLTHDVLIFNATPIHCGNYIIDHL